MFFNVLCPYLELGNRCLKGYLFFIDGMECIVDKAHSVKSVGLSLIPSIILSS